MAYLNPIQIGDRKERYNTGKLPSSKKSDNHQHISLILQVSVAQEITLLIGGLGVLFMERILLLCALGLSIHLSVSNGSLFCDTCAIRREQKNAHTITKLDCSLYLKEVLEIFNHQIVLATQSHFLLSLFACKSQRNRLFLGARAQTT